MPDAAPGTRFVPNRKAESNEPTVVASAPTAPDSDRDRALPTAVLCGLLAIIPRLLTVGHAFNVDEWLWMGRSVAFSDALLHADPGGMSADKPLLGTMPGIPTVWLGSVGRLLWNIAKMLGLVDTQESFSNAASGFTCAQIAVAVATSVLIALLAWLVTKWMSSLVGLVAGAVLAVEPFWVSLGSILHTDELVALFGSTGLVALSWALGLPEGVRTPRHPRRWVAAGTALVTCSVLTKLNGLGFAIPGVGLIAWAAIRTIRRRDVKAPALSGYREALGLVALAGLASLVTVIVLYPALVFDPSGQIDALARTIEISAGDRHVFFRGKVVVGPGPGFYPIALAYHSTFWVSVLLPVGIVVAVVRRSTRRFAILALLFGSAPGLTLLTTTLAYARYGLVILGPLSLAAAMAFHAPPLSMNRCRTLVTRLAGVSIAGAFVFSVVVAPWPGLAFNPGLSAARPPMQVVSVGWGEAPSIAAPIIRRDAARQGLTCAEVTVAGLGVTPQVGSCHFEKTTNHGLADYVVVSAGNRQMWAWTMQDLASTHDLIEIGRVHGQPIAEIWRRRDPVAK